MALFVPMRRIDQFSELMAARRAGGAVTYDSIWRGYNQDGGMPMDGFALVVRDTKELLNVSHDTLPSELFDSALLRQAHAELGLKVK